MHRMTLLIAATMGLAWVGVGGVGCGGDAGGERVDPAAAARAESWQRDVVPILDQYCTDCHSGAEPDGSLDLMPHVTGDVPALERLRAETELFERMASYVADGAMPPAGSGEVPEAARAAFATWFHEAVDHAWTVAPPDPGRVTMRRLSRYEYRNTVRDLVGVPIDVEKHLPADDVGYGFDHIGDVLSMPPLLFEKYLAASEYIASKALPVVHPEDREPKRLPAAECEITKGKGRAAGSSVVLFSNGDVSTSLYVPRDGRYRIRVSASAQQAGPGPARMELRDNRRVLRSVAVEATDEAPGTYEVEVDLARGRHVIAAAFVNDYYRPRHRNPKLRGDRNLHVQWLETHGPLDDDTRPLHERAPLVVAHDASDAEALPRIVRALLARAFRRPPEDAEVTRHLALVMRAQEAGESTAGSLQALLEAVLVSPHFLFRVELDERADPGARVEPLGDHALASRLSYFLWSSLPDERLRTLADEGRLRDELHGEVVRMLADEKSRALVENFAVQWLELRRLETATPDAQQFRAFSEGLRADMRKETELFFEAILREDRSILDLLDAPFTFLNDRLAAHYGIEGVRGRAMQRVSLEGSARGGLLGHASILTLTSYPNRTSVVQRGKWVMEELLGTPPPPPPPGVGTLEEQSSEMLQLSLRERLAAHRENPACAVCHDRMDNLGYGLENFDAIGAWRTKDGVHPVDAEGELPDGRRFAGPQALKQLLREDPNVPRCFAEKLLTYALGRGLEPYDRSAVREIVAAAKAKGLRLSAFVHAIVASDAFTMRRSSGGTE